MDPLLAFSFLAGFGSFFSPCSVALIPAYVGYALKGKMSNPSLFSKTTDGLIFGSSSAFGILLVYLIFAIAASLARNLVAPVLFYFALGTGILLIILGVLMFIGKARGFEIVLPFKPHSPLAGFLTFGIAFGLGSLGCTLPLFLLVISNALVAQNPTVSLLHFVFFALPITLLIIGFTLASFFAREAVARFLGKFTPIILRLSALIITLAGVYIIYFQFRAKFLF